MELQEPARSTEKNSENNLAKDFIKKLVGFSIPTWISFFISFLSVPIVTRLFTPDDVGKINLFAIYITVFLLLSLFGLDQSFVRFFNEPPGKCNRNGLLIISVVLGLLIACVIIVILFFMKDRLAIEITGTKNNFILPCLALSLIANILVRYIGLYYRMENNVLLFSIQAVALTIVGKMLYVSVAIWNPSYVYAIIANTVGYCLLAVIFSILIYKTKLRGKIGNTMLFDKGTIIELFKFGGPLVPVSLLAWLNNSMSQLLLNKYVDFAAIGIYGNAVSVAGLIGLVQAGFSTYWVPFVYANYQTERDTIAKLHNLVTFLMVIFGLLIIIGQDVIYFLIGSNFRDSKIFFPLLLISPICYTISDTTGIGIEISKKSYLHLFPFIASVGLNLSLCVVLLPKIGVIGAAIAAAAASIFKLIITTAFSQKYYRTITQIWKPILALMIVVVAAMLNIVFFDWIVYRSVALIVLSIVLILIYRTEFMNVIKFFLDSMGVGQGRTKHE